MNNAVALTILAGFPDPKIFVPNILQRMGIQDIELVAEIRRKLREKKYLERSDIEGKEHVIFALVSAGVLKETMRGMRRRITANWEILEALPLEPEEINEEPYIARVSGRIFAIATSEEEVRSLMEKAEEIYYIEDGLIGVITESTKELISRGIKPKEAIKIGKAKKILEKMEIVGKKAKEIAGILGLSIEELKAVLGERYVIDNGIIKKSITIQYTGKIVLNKWLKTPKVAEKIEEILQLGLIDRYLDMNEYLKVVALVHVKAKKVLLLVHRNKNLEAIRIPTATVAKMLMLGILKEMIIECTNGYIVIGLLSKEITLVALFDKGQILGFTIRDFLALKNEISEILSIR